MNDPRLMKYGMQPLVKGLVGGIAASVVLGVGTDSKLSLGGITWSAPTVIGVSVAGASIVSELSHDFVLMKIKGNNASLAELEQRTLAPLLTAAAKSAPTLRPASKLCTRLTSTRNSARKLPVLPKE